MSSIRQILELLQDGGWSRGLDLVKHSNGGVWRASVYVHLATLEDSGFVVSRYRHLPDAEFSQTNARMREYQITGRGREALLREDL
jgi:DNA-binding PadR family transcriptional regulator